MKMVDDYRVLVLAEDHNGFSSFLKKVIKQHNSTLVLSEHVAYGTLDLNKVKTYEQAIKELDRYKIPYSGYLKTLYNTVSETTVQKIIGCDYKPKGIGFSEKRNDFIRVVDKMDIEESFQLREAAMEEALSTSIGNESEKIIMSVGGEHLRNKNIDGYPSIPPVINKYKNSKEVLIVLFPDFNK